MDVILGHEPMIEPMYIHRVKVPMLGTINDFKLPTFSRIREVRVNLDDNTFEVWYEVPVADYNSSDFEQNCLSTVRSQIFVTGAIVGKEYLRGHLKTFFMGDFVYHLYAYMVEG